MEGVEEVARRVCADLSLGHRIERFASGSLPVFAVSGQFALKLFPAAERGHFETEVSALSAIGGVLPIPTPRVVAVGDRDGWFYVAMTRMPGRMLSEAWSEIPDDSRVGLMRDVGAGLARLHAIPTSGLERLAVDWSVFIESQRTTCEQRQRDLGLAPAWCAAIGRFLSRWLHVSERAGVLLHTEIMREHLLVERHAGGWRLSGLIDFEPAMIGAPDYEFAAVGVYLSGGNPELMRAVMSGYGIDPDAGFPMRAMAYTLLHRYGNVRRYLEFLPFSGEAGDFEALAHRWFGTEG